MSKDTTMKVFLSWSGELSYKVAKALYEWLPLMIQPVRPFLSSDISKGSRWGEVVERDLKDAEYGIICVTPYNLLKPWMNFEAGALSRFIDRARVTPFLFGVQPSCITGPLAQYESAVYCENDVFKLVQSINQQLGSGKLDYQILERTFKAWWPELQQKLDSVKNGHGLEEETRTEYKWLFTFDDLANHESDTDYHSVWVVTSDLVRYATGNAARQRLTERTSKGINYRFFLPDSQQTDRNDLRDLEGSCLGKLRYRMFPKDLFESQAVTDYIIFNAETEKSPLRMFLKLPIEAGEFWIRVDEHSARNFTARFRMLWDEPNREELHAKAGGEAPCPGALRSASTDDVSARLDGQASPGAKRRSVSAAEKG